MVEERAVAPQEIGGRRSAHGRVRSSCAETRIRSGSAFGPPTSCTLSGRPSRENPDGIAAAAVFWYASCAVYAVVWVAVYIMK